MIAKSGNRSWLHFCKKATILSSSQPFADCHRQKRFEGAKAVKTRLLGVTLKKYETILTFTKLL